jgi:NAD(P)-dependent dehydrogenase (short-subunit alcohol dehydrogenase family)
MNGRRAVVTGGAQGIGAAVARRLASAGMRVAVADLPERQGAAQALAEEIRGARAAMDVTDEKSVGHAMEDVAPVDVLVNCAGITIPFQPVNEVTLADWNRQISVNLTGTFLCMRVVAGGMLDRGWGRIVNLASALATRGMAGSAAYSASKAGVTGLTRAAAADFASRGVTVNAVAPGYVDTPMTQAFPPGVKERRLEEIAMGRFATADEIASVIQFLCSDESRYMTGALIDVTGGFRIQ